MPEVMKASNETGLPSQSPNHEINIQDGQESHAKILESEEPSANDLPSSGEHSDLATDPKTGRGSSSTGTVTPNPELQSTMETSRQRYEQLVSAKVALKNAARKLRDVVAVDFPSLEVDIEDINQAIDIFAGQSKQKNPTFQPPFYTPIPPPPLMQGPRTPQPRLPGLLE